MKHLWDLLGNDLVENYHFSQISENDVLFSVRFFWFHEPSAELVHTLVRTRNSISTLISTDWCINYSIDPEALQYKTRVAELPGSCRSRLCTIMRIAFFLDESQLRQERECLAAET